MRSYVARALQICSSHLTYSSVKNNLKLKEKKKREKDTYSIIPTITFFIISQQNNFFIFQAKQKFFISWLKRLVSWDSKLINIKA